MDGYRIEGSYYEVCNCEAICPCRSQDGVSSGLSTYGICDFLLSWNITEGAAGDVDLGGRLVCMAGSYNDDEDGRPWRVIIYVDDGASAEQREILADIYAGRRGGNILFTKWISEVIAVRSARIVLDHNAGAERIRLADLGHAEVVETVPFDGVVTCAITGPKHPGQENVSSFRFTDDRFDFAYDERCGFATKFAYWQ
ncbi:MAG: DUF1326 domain-containing protein [Alphaproteobacteria bacterium]|jgi:hypothetical protein|nr:DUF1326 domain-containing protein [Alphaproteobacteria bacterium]